MRSIEWWHRHPKPPHFLHFAIGKISTDTMYRAVPRRMTAIAELLVFNVE